MSYPRPFSEHTPRQRPSQAHADNENHGDTAAFQSEHKGHAGDQNIWAFRKSLTNSKLGHGFYFGHWGTMGKDGYTHVVTTRGKLRKMTALEKRRPKRLWTYEAAGRCRKGEHYSRAYGPLSLDYGLEHAKKVGFQPIPELKDPKFGYVSVANDFIKTFKNHNIACWPKALANLPGFERKAKAFLANDVVIGCIGGKKGQRQKAKMVAKANREGWKIYSW